MPAGVLERAASALPVPPNPRTEPQEIDATREALSLMGWTLAEWAGGPWRIGGRKVDLSFAVESGTRAGAWEAALDAAGAEESA